VPAIARLGGKTGLYRQMLRRFVDELAGMPGALQGLAASADRVSAARLLHTVKGVAATLGADGLAALAAQGERELGAGGAPGSAPQTDTRPVLGRAGVAMQAAIPGLTALWQALRPDRRGPPTWPRQSLTPSAARCARAAPAG